MGKRRFWTTGVTQSATLVIAQFELGMRGVCIRLRWGVGPHSRSSVLTLLAIISLGDQTAAYFSLVRPKCMLRCRTSDMSRMHLTNQQTLHRIGKAWHK
ncbi:hypothetical protein RE6C_03381 [Rhodopirellula europaea 6C]|uniref:Uncharacterized protein n=1 Tax=Rhodopirellula europaea 6C TaxID=1263867 RepID=M2B0X8_9BACT|nr:hypothetical protein RE6C_03381 [Rhodopirellula europaea 6C]